MKIGTVTGAVWSSRKATCLSGQTFLVVQTPEGEVVAADHVGAGKGDKVLLVTGTVASRFCMWRFWIRGRSICRASRY